MEKLTVANDLLSSLHIVFMFSMHVTNWLIPSRVYNVLTSFRDLIRHLPDDWSKFILVESMMFGDVSVNEMRRALG